MLTLHDIKRYLNPDKPASIVDDYRIIRSWAEYVDGSSPYPEQRKLKYLIYEIEVCNQRTGQIDRVYKAIKFARVIRVPASAKQSTSLMELQEKVIRGCYSTMSNTITVIANIIKPKHIGLLFLYGIQCSAKNLDDAKAMVDDKFYAFIGSMQGAFRVLEMKVATADEIEWLRDKMFHMDYLTVIRGIPWAEKAGEDAGNRGIGASNLNPDSQGCLENIITGMARYEYVLEVLTSPVLRTTIRGWADQYRALMTEYYPKLQGSDSIGLNISLPLMYMGGIGQSQGQSKGYTDAHTVSASNGRNYSFSQGQSAGESFSRNIGRTYGQTYGQSLTNSYNQGVSHTRGTSFGQSIGESRGVSENYSEGQSFGQSFNRGISHNVGQSANVSVGQSMNLGRSTGQSANMGNSFSQGINASQSRNLSQGTSVNQSFGQNVSASHSLGQGRNVGINTSESVNIGNSASYGQSASRSLSRGISENFGTSQNSGWSSSSSASFGKSSSASTGGSWNHSSGYSANANDGANSSNGSGGSVTAGAPGIASGSGSMNASHGRSHGNGDGLSWSDSYGGSSSVSDSSSQTMSNSAGTSGSVGMSHSMGASVSSGASFGQSVSLGESMGLGRSVGTSNGYSMNEGFSVSNGQSLSSGWGANSSISNGVSFGQSANYGQTMGFGQNIGISQGVGQSASQSFGVNESVGESYSVGQNYSQSMSHGFGQNYGVSRSQNISASESVGTTESLGQSVGQSVSKSASASASSGYGQNYGRNESISSGNSYSTSDGVSNSISNAVNSGMSMTTSASMGISVGFNMSHSNQWVNQTAKDLIEVMQFMHDRIAAADLTDSGMFYTYVYLGCPTAEALSTAQGLAASTWYNEYAKASPLQVLTLPKDAQTHMLYKFVAFSADLTRETVGYKDVYRYATALRPSEIAAYTHLPRVSYGGIFATVADIPKFSTPAMMRGEIYMGKILNPEVFDFENGYVTPSDCRLDESSLMHTIVTGGSRSGKTVTAMRYIQQLAMIRRKRTGKRLRIVVMDPKQDWRDLARYVEPERFNFYSMGNPDFQPVKINVWKIPMGVRPQLWIDGIIAIYCRSYGFLERGKQIISQAVFQVYEEAGVMAIDTGKPGWQQKVHDLSGQVSFTKIYQRFKQDYDAISAQRAGNATKEGYERILERMSCFSRSYSIESQLYGGEDGLCIDELIGADDVTVLESKGLEATFRNFVFGCIVSGFYKYAYSHDGGFLADDQYETVLVVEEANEVLTGNDTAKGGDSLSLPGESEFEQVIDQSAGFGLFVVAITQKISSMPSSIIANCGTIFAGNLGQVEDVNIVVRKIGREERMDDRETAKYMMKSPIGWFIVKTGRTMDYKEMDPILVKIAMLSVPHLSNQDIAAIMESKRAKKRMARFVQA